jgi:RNA:NAD 2'-phosphotransferase (TPT1/KptA family)
LSTENYVDGCRAAGRQLQGHGYQLVVSRNSWESLDYKGINTRWRTTEGRVFEVQFHTPESFEAKQLTHGAYERLRNPLTDKSEMGELRQFQRQVTAQIPVPDLVSDIRNFSEKDG